MDKRLKAIEQRAEALGWTWENLRQAAWAILQLCNRSLTSLSEKEVLDIAERLLSLYEPGVWVEVENYTSKVPDQRALVTWYTSTTKTKINGGVADSYPPPGTYKVVPWPQEEGDGEAASDMD